MCFSGGSSTNTTTTSQQPFPAAVDAYTNAQNRANYAANLGAQTYGGQIVATNPMLPAAAANTLNLSSDWAPYAAAAYGNLQNVPGYGQTATGYGQTAAGTAGYYGGQAATQGGGYAGEGYTWGTQAPGIANYYGGIANTAGAAGIGAAGSAAGFANEVGGAAGGIADQYGNQATTAAGSAPGLINTYLSPYTKQVVDATQAQFNNQNAIQNAGVVGNAAAQGAWGGDRSAVAQGIVAGQQQTAQAPVIAGLYQQGYQQAVQAAQQQAQLQAATGVQAGQLGLGATQQQINAAIAGGQLGIGAAGQQAQIALGAGQLGIAGTGQAAQTGLGAAQQATAANLGAGQLANQANLGAGQLNLGAGELETAAATGIGNLGQQNYNVNLGALNAQIAAGGLQQQQQQAQLNVPYQQWLAAQAYPYQSAQFLANIAEGTGGLSGGTSSTTSPAASPISQIAGLGIGAAGLIGATGGFGQEGWLTGNEGLLNFSGNQDFVAARGGAIPHRQMGGIIPGGGPAPGQPGAGLAPGQMNSIGTGVPDVSMSVIPLGGGTRTPTILNPMASTGQASTTTGGGGGSNVVGDIGAAAGLARLGLAIFARDGGAVPHRQFGGYAPSMGIAPNPGNVSRSFMPPDVSVSIFPQQQQQRMGAGPPHPPPASGTASQGITPTSAIQMLSSLKSIRDLSANGGIFGSPSDGYQDGGSVVDDVGNAFSDMARSGLSYYNRALSGQLKREPLGNLRTLATLAPGLGTGFGRSGAMVGGLLGPMGDNPVARGVAIASPEPEYWDTKTGRRYDPANDMARGGGIMGYQDGGDIDLPDVDVTTPAPERTALNRVASDMGIVPPAAIPSSMPNTSDYAAQPYRPDPWLALAAAGFGAAAGRSPQAMQNLGAGALEGLKFYEQERQVAPRLNLEQAQLGLIPSGIRLREAEAQKAETEAQFLKSQIGWTPEKAYSQLSSNIVDAAKAHALENQPLGGPVSAEGPLQQATVQVASANGIDPQFALAHIKGESNFDPSNVGPAVDGHGRPQPRPLGIAQFDPETAARWGVQNPMDPQQALGGYGRYFGTLLKQTGGNYEKAAELYGTIPQDPARDDKNQATVRAAAQAANARAADGTQTAQAGPSAPGGLGAPASSTQGMYDFIYREALRNFAIANMPGPLMPEQRIQLRNQALQTLGQRLQMDPTVAADRARLEALAKSQVELGFAGPIEAAKAGERFQMGRPGSIAFKGGQPIGGVPELRQTVDPTTGQKTEQWVTPPIEAPGAGPQSSGLITEPASGVQEQQKAANAEYQDATKEAKTAQENRLPLQAIESAMENFRTGPSAETRLALGRAWQDFRQSAGAAPDSDLAKWIGSGEVITKEGTRLGYELARTLGSREAAMIVQQAIKSNPSLFNSPEGNREIIGLIRQGLQRDEDKRDFFDTYAAHSGGTFIGASHNFNQTHPAEQYIYRVMPPTHPPIGVPGGSSYSPSRGLWRDPQGRFYNAIGAPISTGATGG